MPYAISAFSFRHVYGSCHQLKAAWLFSAQGTGGVWRTTFPKHKGFLETTDPFTRYLVVTVGNKNYSRNFKICLPRLTI